MEIETRPGWSDAWVEFQWPRVQLMAGYNLAEWIIGVRVSRAGWWCVSLYFLCFDCHLQIWSPDPLFTGESAEKGGAK